MKHKQPKNKSVFKSNLGVFEFFNTKIQSACSPNPSFTSAQTHKSHLKYLEYPSLEISDIQSRVTHSELRNYIEQESDDLFLSEKEETHAEGSTNIWKKRKRQTLESETVDPIKVFNDSFERKKRKIHSENFFRFYSTNSAMKSDNKFFWKKLDYCIENEDCIEDEECVSAVLLCNEAYRLNFVPTVTLDIEKYFPAFIRKYMNDDCVQHVEFARVRSCIISYLFKYERIDELYQLVLYGIEEVMFYLCFEREKNEVARRVLEKLSLVLDGNDHRIQTLKICLNLQKSVVNHYQNAIDLYDEIPNQSLGSIILSCLVFNIHRKNFKSKKNAFLKQEFIDHLKNYSEIHFFHIEIFLMILNKKPDFFGLVENELIIKLKMIALYKGDVYQTAKLYLPLSEDDKVEEHAASSTSEKADQLFPQDEQLTTEFDSYFFKNKDEVPNEQSLRVQMELNSEEKVIPEANKHMNLMSDKNLRKLFEYENLFMKLLVAKNFTGVYDDESEWEDYSEESAQFWDTPAR